MINIAYFHICLIARDWYDRLKKYYMRCETQSNANGIHTPPISMLSEISISRFKPWKALYQDLGNNYLSHFLLSKDAIVFNFQLDVIGF